MIRKTALATLAALAATPAMAGSFAQTNLVSDGAIAAAVTDPNLKNAWGISYSPTGDFWVSDNATGLTTLYNGAGAITPAGRHHPRRRRRHRHRAAPPARSTTPAAALR